MDKKARDLYDKIQYSHTMRKLDHRLTEVYDPSNILTTAMKMYLLDRTLYELYVSAPIVNDEGAINLNKVEELMDYMVNNIEYLSSRGILKDYSATQCTKIRKMWAKENGKNEMFKKMEEAVRRINFKTAPDLVYLIAGEGAIKYRFNFTNELMTEFIDTFTSPVAVCISMIANEVDAEIVHPMYQANLMAFEARAKAKTLINRIVLTVTELCLGNKFSIDRELVKEIVDTMAESIMERYDWRSDDRTNITPLFNQKIDNTAKSLLKDVMKVY